MHSDTASPVVPGDQRPIGYWLKHLDQLIEQAFDHTLNRENLTRLQWQALTVLVRRAAGDAGGVGAGGVGGGGVGVGPDDLRAELAPFLRAPTAAVSAPDRHQDPATAVGQHLVGRGWAQVDENGQWRLTEAGRRDHDDLLQKVTTTRRRTVQGISDDEYRSTVDVLRRMADNLSGPG